MASVAGVVVFLAFLFFAVQLLSNLYATSVVTATGYDAARRVASGTVDHEDPAALGRAQSSAERWAKARLGRYGGRVRFDWSGSDRINVRLRVEADNPDLLLFANRLLGFDHVVRTIVVRVEEVR